MTKFCKCIVSLHATGVDQSYPSFACHGGAAGIELRWMILLIYRGCSLAGAYLP